MKYLQLKEQLLNEINMSPGSLRRAAKDIGARAGMEFEMIVKGAAESEEGDDYQEPDYDRDESIGDIQSAFDFFYDSDYNSRRDCQRLVDKMREDYQEWLSEQLDNRWDSDSSEVVYRWLRENASEDDIGEILGKEFDEENEITKQDYIDAADKVREDRIDPWYDDARQDFSDDFYNDSDLESEWLDDEGISTMQDVESRYSITWPHYFNPDTSGGEVSVGDAADSFSRAIGREVQASGNYHSRSVARPSATKLHYVVEPDGSLDADDSSDGGLEFVSPALPIDELLDDLKKVKAWADKSGNYTNDSTGLHINVSVPAWQGDLSKLDYVKLAVLMGDEYVLQEFGRQGNTYCKSALKIVKDNIRQRPEDVKQLLDTMKDHLNTSAAKLIHSGSTNKYTSVNTKDGYIEFRSPGGDWLNDNFDKIESTLLRFVVAMDAAVDETKYKEEYAKKLYKLLAGDQKDSTNTMTYFAKYAAGELPKSALKSFIKQAQLERNQSKEPDGNKDNWEVYNSYTGEVIGTFTSVDPNGTMDNYDATGDDYRKWRRENGISNTDPRSMSRRPIFDKPRYELFNLNRNKKLDEPVPGNVTTDEQALTFLDDYINHGPHGLKPYQAKNLIGIRRWGDSNAEPILAQPIRATSGEPQPAGSVGQSSRFEIYRVSDGRTVERNGQPLYVNANSLEDAEEQAIQIIAAANLGAPALFNVRSVLQPPTQSSRVATSFTGQWKVVDGLNREVYRFRPAENTRAKANELAALWARENNFDGNYQVEPADEPASTPVSGSTLDLQRQRAAAAQAVHDAQPIRRWRIMMGGEQVFVVNAATQGEANELARQWLSQRSPEFNADHQGQEAEVVPVTN